MAAPRASSSVVAVALLALVAVLAAAVVGSATLAAAPDGTPDLPRTRIAVGANATSDRITLTHHGGATLDARDVRVLVSVDGRRLAHQPPVPFFAARGFVAGPTGPFNAAANDHRLQAGETASFRVARTNSQRINDGSHVRVVVYRNETRVAVGETRAT